MRVYLIILVFYILEYNEEYGYDWPLRETEVKILDRHQEALVNYLHASEILPILHVMQGINKRQRESIDSEPTEYQKNEALLETVRRFSLKSYSVFIQCIRMSGHSHVADLLEYDGCKFFRLIITDMDMGRFLKTQPSPSLSRPNP